MQIKIACKVEIPKSLRVNIKPFVAHKYNKFNMTKSETFLAEEYVLNSTKMHWECFKAKATTMKVTFSVLCVYKDKVPSSNPGKDYLYQPNWQGRYLDTVVVLGFGRNPEVNTLTSQKKR